MPCPFDGPQWNDAVVLSAVWSGAPGRSGEKAFAIRQTLRETKFWQWDDEVFTHPTLVGRHPGKYNLRRAAWIISKAEEGGVCACRPDDISVDGEVGWRADLLAIAWYRDGDNDCLPTPLASILSTLSDGELAEFAAERGGLRDEDLFAVSWFIGELIPGTGSVLPLLRDSLVRVEAAGADGQAEAFEDIEERAEQWKKKERGSRLDKHAAEIARAIELKEWELFSRPGERAQFAQRAAEFRAALEHAVYAAGDLPREAKETLADEERIRSLAAADTSFSKEELEAMSECSPPHSMAVRACILAGWSRVNSLPSRLGSFGRRHVSLTEPLNFLRWLFEDRAPDVLAELNKSDPAAATLAVERVLHIAFPSALRLARSGGFSGRYAGLGRGRAEEIVKFGGEVEAAGRAGGVTFSSTIEVPREPPKP